MTIPRGAIIDAVERRGFTLSDAQVIADAVEEALLENLDWVGEAVMEVVGFPGHMVWGGDGVEVLEGLRSMADAFVESRSTEAIGGGVAAGEDGEAAA